MPTKKKIRYAVVGLGHIAQVAVLPAFKNAGKNSELTALVSNDPEKLRKLGKRYGVENQYSYDEYEDCLESGKIDAIYVALPNSMHRQFTVRAAQAGVHVLCEKPLATSVADGEAMIAACRKHRVKLMTAYRLHLDRATLTAAELANSGKLGDLKAFSSTFSYQVAPGNIRLKQELGGSPVFDIGIYCINAARLFFRDEPIEVFATLVNSKDKRFKEVEMAATVLLTFPRDRTAQFTCSFGAAESGAYDVVGTKGSLRMDNGYEYAAGMELLTRIEGRQQSRKFARHDQFGAELVHFSDCIQKSREIEPSGEEGLADLRVIQAIFESGRFGKLVQLKGPARQRFPKLKDAMELKAVKVPPLVNVPEPYAD